MEKLENPICDQCGTTMSLDYRKSSGMDIEPTGLFAVCGRCGYEKRVRSLSER